MKAATEKERICPICKMEYRAHPAISRKDNFTLICPDCACREAMDAISIPKDEQEKIIQIMHKYS
jgi:predicted  nucleic acid-binding Zn ribbon protein